MDEQELKLRRWLKKLLTALDDPSLDYDTRHLMLAVVKDIKELLNRESTDERAA
jgi:predicted component of type VI protein secretion system